jgi:DNA-binding IclR family transcriptional regulator
MIVRQAANVLDILEHFAKTKKPVTLAELSAAMGWPRSSTFNLITTLEQRGFLYEPRPRGGFYPSPRWLALLQGIADTEMVPEALCSAADDIARTTGETVAVAGPAGLNAVFLYVVESQAAIRFSAMAGSQVPIHATSSGRALLAQYSPRERASILRKVTFEEYPLPAPMSPADVEAEIEREAARGWFETEGGHGDEVTGVALPAGVPDRPLALVVGGPASRVHKHVPQIVEAMRAALWKHLG